MYKVMNDMSPVYLNKRFRKRETPYTTRSISTTHLHVPFPRLEYKKRSFSYTGAIRSNSLHDNVKSAINTRAFKTLYAMN